MPKNVPLVVIDSRCFHFGRTTDKQFNTNRALLKLMRAGLKQRALAFAVLTNEKLIDLKTNLEKMGVDSARYRGVKRQRWQTTSIDHADVLITPQEETLNPISCYLALTTHDVLKSISAVDKPVSAVLNELTRCRGKWGDLDDPADHAIMQAFYHQLERNTRDQSLDDIWAKIVTEPGIKTMLSAFAKVKDEEFPISPRFLLLRQLHDYFRKAAQGPDNTDKLMCLRANIRRDFHDHNIDDQYTFMPAFLQPSRNARHYSDTMLVKNHLSLLNNALRDIHSAVRQNWPRPESRIE